MAQSTQLDFMTGGLAFLRGLTTALAVATAVTAPVLSAKLLAFNASCVILCIATIAYGEWAVRSLRTQGRK